MTTPRVNIQCAYCKEQEIDSSAWIDAVGITSTDARDAHRHNPEHFSDQCKGFFVIAQKGMFSDILNMGLEDIEKWANAIQTVALEAPFDTNVYINLCGDMNMSNPIGYDKLMEAYEGKYESFTDFVKDCHDYAREDIPSLLCDYIDWEGVSRRFERRGFFYYMSVEDPCEVHVFSTKYLRNNIK